MKLPNIQGIHTFFIRNVCPIVILSLCFFSQLVAQHQDTQKAGNTLLVRGLIQHKETLQPIAYATLSIVCRSVSSDADTLQQVTDDGGRFEMALPLAEKYVFLPSFVGLKADSLVLTQNELRSKGLVRLSMKADDNLLSEVVVVAKKPIVRLGIDRIAYNVKEDPMNKALSLHEMMRRVPLVTIDGDGNLQVKGTSNFAIYLNGRPSSFISSNPKEVLKSIPASSVQNIEVITNPGVEYDATGASIIINIITQKGINLKGIMGTVTAGTLFHNGLMGSANLSAAMGKASFTGSYHVMDYWMPKKYANYTSEENYTTSYYRKSNTEPGAMKFRSHTLNLNFNYEFNKKNLLSTSFNWNKQHTPSFSNYTDNVTYAPHERITPLSTEHLVSTTMMLRNSYEFRTDYEHDFDRNNEKLILSYLFVRNPVKNTDSRVLDVEKDKVNILHRALSSTNIAHLDEHTWQADYTLPIREQHKINSGIKYIYRRGNSFSKYSSPEDVGATLDYFGVKDTVSMNYRQQIFAAYLKYMLSLGDFSGSAGVRLETGAQKVQYGEDFSRKFTDVVPELGLSYSFNQGLQLKANYNLRISRPSIQQLSPYTQAYSVVFIYRGNSKLINERIHNLEVSIGSYGKKLTLQGGLNANYTKNPIASIFLYGEDKEGRIINTFENLGFNRGVGASLFARYIPFTWFNVMFNGSVRYDEFDAGKVISPSSGKEYIRNNKGWSGQFSGILNFTLPRNWTIVAYAGLFSQPVSITMDPFWGTYHGMNVVKSFFNGKLSLAANIQNPFMKYYHFRIRMFGPDFESKTVTSRRALQLNFTISYTFGELQSAIKKVSKTIINQDISTAKDSSMQGGDNK